MIISEVKSAWLLARSIWIKQEMGTHPENMSFLWCDQSHVCAAACQFALVDLLWIYVFLFHCFVLPFTVYSVVKSGAFSFTCIWKSNIFSKLVLGMCVDRVSQIRFLESFDRADIDIYMHCMCCIRPTLILKPVISYDLLVMQSNKRCGNR